MKKKFLKIVTAWALILCMSFPAMMTAQAENTNDGSVSDGSVAGDAVGAPIPFERFVVQHHLLIDEFRGEENLAPPAPKEYEEYLFAGWFQDEQCRTALDSEVKKGPAYAKYVHKDVLSVHAQLLKGTNFNTETSNVRFVSTVDSLAYQKVGFFFEVYGNEITYESENNYVYYKLNYIDNAADVMEEYTPDMIHKSSKYFYACTIKDVLNESFDYRIHVTPYWITLDGTTVKAETVTKSINNGYTSDLTDADAVQEVADGGIALPGSSELQGGTKAGKFYYLVSSIKASDDTNNGTALYVFKRDAADSTKWVGAARKAHGEIKAVSDITYNATDLIDVNQNMGRLVMTSDGDTENTTKITEINPSSLEVMVDTTTVVPFAIASITHNERWDKYVVMLDDGSVKILDNSFKAEEVTFTTPSALTGYTSRSITADDSYLYQMFTKTENEGTTNVTSDNMIAIYDWSGNYVTTVEVAFHNYPIMNIDIADNIIYAACDAGSRIYMYNIDIKKIFDIVYHLGDDGTTTNPDTYTINSEDITLSAPEREGYDFLGWSQETVSLSEIEWNDGFVDKSDGKTPYDPEATTIPEGWENAIYSEPILLKGGMKHTLTGTDIPELRWRVFADDTLKNGSTFSEKYVSLPGDRYVVLVLIEKPSEEDLASLKIHSEPSNRPTISYTEGNTKKTILLDSWTKGLIKQDLPWEVTYGETGYENAIYSDEIELKAGVEYTLSGYTGEVRWRKIPSVSTEAVKNVDSDTTYTPSENCTIRILLPNGYTENTNITIAAGSTGDRTYTASWIRNSFQVKYDPNGGEGSVRDSIHQFGQESTLEANIFTKAGYTFTGWNTKKDGSGTAYADLATVSSPMTDGSTTVDWSKEESITLYAQWYIREYDITYDYGEGGTVATENPDKYTIITDDFTLNRPTRPGYTFAGWKENIYLEAWYDGFLDLEDGHLVENSIYTDSKYSERIYLQGDRNKTRVYTLVVPGLEKGKEATIRARMFYDTGAFNNILTGNFEHRPVWNGYVSYMLHLGQYGADLSENAVYVMSNTQEEYAAQPSVADIDITIVKGSNGDRHYEALWVPNNYTVHYNPNVGEGTVNGTMTDSVYTYEKVMKLSKNTFEYTNSEGVECVFTGWNTEPDGTGKTYADEASVSLDLPSSEEITLYAQWASTDIYNITYNLDGGSLAEGESNPTRYAKTSESFTLKTPTKDGYVFKEWKETITLEGLSSDSENGSWIPGFVNETTGVIETDNTTFANALYADYIYLQKGRTYTLDATNVDRDYLGVRWRIYNSDETYYGNKTDSAFTPRDYSYYVRFLLPWGFVEGANPTVTITSEASSITIDKGTTGNRTYTAIWEKVSN